MRACARRARPFHVPFAAALPFAFANTARDACDTARVDVDGDDDDVIVDDDVGGDIAVVAARSNARARRENAAIMARR